MSDHLDDPHGEEPFGVFDSPFAGERGKILPLVEMPSVADVLRVRLVSP